MLTARLKQAWSRVAERGRTLLHKRRPANPAGSIETLALDLLSERGEATNMARADAIVRLYGSLSKEQREFFHLFLALNFLPESTRLKAAAKAYLNAPTAETVAELALASEPPRQELIRRMNVAPGATALLVRMREELLAGLEKQPQLKPLEQDLRRLLASWFNRGFLTLKRIDWSNSAAMLEKVIAYEAVHEIHGWDDLRRRLAPDRRCFAFFHPALPDEPLIFVEVALCQGLASKIAPLLSASAPADDPAQADTAIFYSISNCQPGLRGISFGNFLIKQVVDELRAELPGLKRFATLSPVPGFKRWLNDRESAERKRVAGRIARHQLGQCRAREPGDQGRASAPTGELSDGGQRRKRPGRSGGAIPSRKRRAAGTSQLGGQSEPARNCGIAQHDGELCLRAEVDRGQSRAVRRRRPRRTFAGGRRPAQAAVAQRQRQAQWTRTPRGELIPSDA